MLYFWYIKDFIVQVEVLCFGKGDLTSLKPKPWGEDNKGVVMTVSGLYVAGL